MFAALPAEARGALRIEHIGRWRSARPGLTPAQAKGTGSRDGLCYG
ncbi:hypothetical protein ACH49O_33065 [Streptomyces coeruleorubidus]